MPWRDPSRKSAGSKRAKLATESRPASPTANARFHGNGRSFSTRRWPVLSAGRDSVHRLIASPLQYDRSALILRTLRAERGGKPGMPASAIARRRQVYATIDGWQHNTRTLAANCFRQLRDRQKLLKSYRPFRSDSANSRTSFHTAYIVPLRSAESVCNSLPPAMRFWTSSIEISDLPNVPSVCPRLRTVNRLPTA